MGLGTLDEVFSAARWSESLLERLGKLGDRGQASLVALTYCMSAMSVKDGVKVSIQVRSNAISIKPSLSLERQLILGGDRFKQSKDFDPPW